MIRPQKVKRYIGLIANHPAIVRNRWDMEQTARRKLNLRSILHGGHRSPGDDQSHVLYIAKWHACARTDMF